MFGFLSKLFNSTSSEMLNELLADGAVLIDVRTRSEFNAGHAKKSKNIPLDEISKSINQFDKEKTYILVCASGVRSRTAVNILKSHGFSNLYNGGSWASFL
ncbi:rhodanese-like domain-containing protein [Massilibacteroides sp.]|uniref:rhodanese-like domain-containing protein n=1 Tax=Massilibacteroides sp. TaxID=2034766 RepID=UPI00261D4A2D|nr:rhodanese-like domain-containing protein [Massilibacteroides sp.]MDD4516142.1 rhodanese-like domain-containing protein [Massilibacteroides sp.]